MLYVKPVNIEKLSNLGGCIMVKTQNSQNIVVFMYFA